MINNKKVNMHNNCKKFLEKTILKNNKTNTYFLIKIFQKIFNYNKMKKV